MLHEWTGPFITIVVALCGVAIFSIGITIGWILCV